jgi:hypothetical protein
LFIAFGVFGFIPTFHHIFRFGFKHAFTGKMNSVVNSSRPIFLSAGATQYLLLVAALYVIGAGLYAGKSNIMIILTFFCLIYNSTNT